MSSSQPVEEEKPLFESWSRTSLKKVRFSHTWTVQDFSARKEQNAEWIDSPTFTTGTDCEWRLKLYPQGVSGYNGWLSVYLELVSSPTVARWVTYTISVMNDKLERSNTFSRDTYKFVKGSTDGAPNFATNSSVTQQGSSLLVDNHLILVCEGTVESTEVQIHDALVHPISSTSNARMDFDLGVLLQSGEFSDVALRVEGAEFKVHKAILSLRSSVFGAMFRTEMAEKQQDEVDIPEIDKSVFRNLLTFIYTGKVTDSEAIGADLLSAADRFDVGGLKTVCEEKMCLELCVEKAAATLGFADLYHAEDLKSQALAYMVTNFHRVVKTEGWKRLVKENQALAAEVMGAVAAKLNCA